MSWVSRAVRRPKFRAPRHHRLRKARRHNKKFLFDGEQRPRAGQIHGSPLGLAGGLEISRVEAQRGITLFEHPSSFQVAVLFVERLFAAVLCDNDGIRRKNSRSCPAQEFKRDRVLFRLFIGRIEKHYFVAFWIWTGWLWIS